MNRIVFATLIFLTALCGATEPEPGASILTSGRRIEYIPGELPLVICAPHGGGEKPAGIRDRTRGVLLTDGNTDKLANAIANELQSRTGKHVHLVICHLHRSKLDVNREIGEAAQGNAAAEQSWNEYHGFIEQAVAAAIAKHGRAFLIDIHGHGHASHRVELGYLHTVADLAKPEAFLNTPAFSGAGSLKLLVRLNPELPYAQLLRGPKSLGALLEEHGFPSTPSPGAPEPIGPFFSGGYTVSRHVSSTQNLAGVQIEAYREGLRDTAENRARFAKALAGALEVYLEKHLGLTIVGK